MEPDDEPISDKEMMEEAIAGKNKQIMAEWLAEKVLGWELCDCGTVHYKMPNGEYKGGERLYNFIYSPAGFFAVWDAVEKKYAITSGSLWNRLYFIFTGDFKCICELDIDGTKRIVGTGQDRYEAFYNAVYEAMKEWK